MTDKTEETTGFKAPKEVLILADKATKAFDDAGAFVIESDDDYSLAAVNLKGYKAQAKTLEEKQKALIDPLNKTKQGIWDLFKPPLDFLKKAEKAIKDTMIVYHDKVEAERKAEQERLEKEAEKERKYQEDLAKKRLATAKKNEDEERIEEVEDEIEEIQTATVAPVVASTRPKVQGVSTRVTWSGDVTDKMALIKAVAAGKAPETLLVVDTTVLNQMARAMKSHLDYPGVKAVSKSGIASR